MSDKKSENNCEFSCATFSYLKDPDMNGGYSQVGDGNQVTELLLTKGNQKMTLNDEEIIQLMKTMRGINPTIQVY